MANLSPTQIAQLARQQGVPDWDLTNFVATALAESKGDPNAAGQWHGLYQFDKNTFNAIAQKYGLDRNGIYDPATNTKAAYYNWMENGGNKGVSISQMPAQWGVWAQEFANHPNSAKNFLGQAQQAVKGAGDASKASNSYGASDVSASKPAQQSGLRAPGVDVPFTPPYGSANDWAFDQGAGRWIDKNDLGKPYDKIPSYHLADGQWKPYQNPSQSKTQNKLTMPLTDEQRAQMQGMSSADIGNKVQQAAQSGKPTLDEMYQPSQMNQTLYGDPMKGNARQWTQDSAGHWFGASQQYPGASDATSGSMPTPALMAAMGLAGFGGLGKPAQQQQRPSLDEMYRPSSSQPYQFQQGGMAGMQNALGPGGMTMQQLSQMQRGASPFGPQWAPGQVMPFGQGRPQLPVTPMQNGMQQYQGAGYTPNGLRLSQMQSGLFSGGVGGGIPNQVSWIDSNGHPQYPHGGMGGGTPDQSYGGAGAGMSDLMRSQASAQAFQRDPRSERAANQSSNLQQFQQARANNPFDANNVFSPAPPNSGGMSQMMQSQAQNIAASRLPASGQMAGFGQQAQAYRPPSAGVYGDPRGDQQYGRANAGAMNDRAYQQALPAGFQEWVAQRTPMQSSMQNLTPQALMQMGLPQKALARILPALMRQQYEAFQRRG